MSKLYAMGAFSGFGHSQALLALIFLAPGVIECADHESVARLEIGPPASKLFVLRVSSSAFLPNAFKIVFALSEKEPLTEFRESNKASGEKLELKKGLSVECKNEWFKKYYNYTLERSII